MWIHENSNWPNFSWDAEALSSKLATVRYRQGHLDGRMEGIQHTSREEARLNTLANDVVKSSAIEGEKLNTEEVRSSLARRLGIKMARFVPVGRDVEGIVQMMTDATQNFSNPLTKKRLFDWHSSMFRTGRKDIRRMAVGAWRTVDAGPMQVVSGSAGREKVHFEAPSAERLKTEMSAFLAWFNKEGDTDPILKAGIAHFWFVTIHPFEDGNGRIARAIGDMALARADATPNRFYSLSTQIEAERKDYYAQLERQQRSTPEITGWLAWFLDCLDRAISSAEQSLSKILFKAELWNKMGQFPINERQRLVINRMLENDFKGHMNTSKYAKLAKCSPDTALRDIQNLKARGILLQNPGGGRSTSYRLPDAIQRNYPGKY